MNAAQRRMLVVALVVGAVVLHLWNGTWIVAPDLNTRQWSTVDLGWLAYEGSALEGLAIPAALLVAAVFLWLGGRQPATASSR